MASFRLTPFRLFLVAQMAGFLLVAGAAALAPAAGALAGMLLAGAGAGLFALGLYGTSRHLQHRIDVLSDTSERDINKVRQDLHLAVHLSQATDAAARRAVYEDYSRQHADMASIFDHPAQARRRQLLLDGSLGASVLEVGCSTGAIAAYFREAGYRAVGMDLSHFALACGAPGVSYTQGDAYRLPFADASLDSVILPEVLEHLEDPAAALREAVRVARQRVVASIPLGPMRDPTHCRIYTHESVRELFAQVPELAVISTDEVEPWVVVTCELRRHA